MSIRQIAVETGFSVATVSRALRNDPKVNTVTKAKICTMAQSLKYKPNPYFGDMMSTLRHRAMKTYKGNLALLIKEKQLPRGQDSRLADVVEGARHKSEELGFSLDVVNLSHVTPATTMRMLESRGVQGVMIFMPSFDGEKVRLRMRLDRFSCVSLGWGLWLPRLDTVETDHHEGMRVGLRHARQKFGAGVAAIWDFCTDEAAHCMARGAFLTHHASEPAVADQLFLSAEKLRRDSMEAVVQKHQVASLILGSNFQPPDWLAEIVPASNWIWCHNPGKVPYFGRVDQQNRLIGEWGANLLATKIRMYQMGVPRSPQRVLVPQIWMPGHSS